MQDRDHFHFHERPNRRDNVLYNPFDITETAGRRNSSCQPCESAICSEHQSCPCNNAEGAACSIAWRLACPWWESSTPEKPPETSFFKTKKTIKMPPTSLSKTHPFSPFVFYIANLFHLFKHHSFFSFRENIASTVLPGEPIVCILMIWIDVIEEPRKNRLVLSTNHDIWHNIRHLDG